MVSRPWLQPRAVLHRFVCDLLAGELFRQRRSAERRPLPWPEDLDLCEDLGVDSLELLALATALAEALHLHESGIEDYLLMKRRLGDWVDIADAGLTRFSDRLTFRTSGSTGTPKPSVHAVCALQQEVAYLTTLFPARRRVLYAVPSHHLYGFLFTVLLPGALGISAADVIDIRGSTPSWLGLGASPGDLVIGHPEFWHSVARTVPQLPDDVVGVTSTAPCPDSVSEALGAAGLSRLVQIYGSSECAGVGYRQSHRDPYQLMPHWTFDRDAGRLLRLLPDGTIRASACQDHLEWLDERSFLVGPRADNAVQVGGINVFPERVREVLKKHPDVQDAAVRLMRPEEGARLKAFVVLKQADLSHDEVLMQLRSLIDTELATPERPKAISFGNELPMGLHGKPADWTLH